MKPLLDHTKYRWFKTSSDKLVVGGKSSTQNDELLKKLKRLKKNYITMHTSTPGSPFAVILSDETPTKKEIEETAVFTGCFSRAWREQKKKVQVDIFSLPQLYKTRKMKTGTWGVKPPIQHESVQLELVLTRQEGKLRAVPLQTPSKKQIFLKIKPGKLDKRDALPKLQVEMAEHVKQDELLQALPPGGVAISRN